MNVENLREMEDCLGYLLEMGLMIVLFLAVIGFACLGVYEVISFIRERNK